MIDNCTVIYYTANFAPEKFIRKNQDLLLKAIGNAPLISVSQKPIHFGYNICVGDIGRSHLNIYRQALIGAKEATTKYIALAEDDIMYAPEHFDHTPTPGFFAYDINVWMFYEFYKPRIFSYKGRINMNSLICERELFIETIEERFKKWPDDSKIHLENWSEPGKNAYEENLGVTKRQKETFMATVPSIAFYHPAALSYLHLGKRKNIGEIKKEILEPWGNAKDMPGYYHK